MNMQSPTRLQCVVPDDEQLLAAVTLGEAMWAESSVYSGMERDIAKMVEFAYTSRANPASFFKVVVHATDGVVGFMIGERAPYGFHDTEFAYDRLLYVVPNRRGSIAARTLIRSFEEWCKTHHVSRILLGVTTGVHAAQTEKFYNKLGYSTVGTVTMKEL